MSERWEEIGNGIYDEVIAMGLATDEEKIQQLVRVASKRIAALEAECCTLQRCRDAIKASVVSTVRGEVEGKPTNSTNYLQRLRELVEIEPREAEERARKEETIERLRGLLREAWDEMRTWGWYSDDPGKEFRCQLCGAVSGWEGGNDHDSGCLDLRICAALKEDNTDDEILKQPLDSSTSRVRSC